jgi:predicted nucleotidyltransferase component of viral defense system
MFNYTLQELNVLANKHNFNRDKLEKVLRLVDLLRIFNEEEELKGKYILKGGTAINLCLFDFPRLSVDIDMNFNLECTKEEMIEIRDKHKKMINAFVELEGYTVSERSRYTFTLDSYLLKYVNSIGNPDNIKLELNYSNRIQIYEPVNYRISSKIANRLDILGLDKVELYGSKIAALIGRTTARDIFDVYKMISNEMITEEELNRLRKCSVFYLMTSNDFQSIKELLNIFDQNIDNITFNNIRRNLIPMLQVGSQLDLDLVKNTIKDYIEKLLKLNIEEIQFVDSFIEGKYHPEYLFNSDIATRINNHPMALWKVMKKN